MTSVAVTNAQANYLNFYNGFLTAGTVTAQNTGIAFSARAQSNPNSLTVNFRFDNGTVPANVGAIYTDSTLANWKDFKTGSFTFDQFGGCSIQVSLSANTNIVAAKALYLTQEALRTNYVPTRDANGNLQPSFTAATLTASAATAISNVALQRLNYALAGKDCLANTTLPTPVALNHTAPTSTNSMAILYQPDPINTALKFGAPLGTALPLAVVIGQNANNLLNITAANYPFTVIDLSATSI